MVVVPDINRSSSSMINKFNSVASGGDASKPNYGRQAQMEVSCDALLYSFRSALGNAPTQNTPSRLIHSPRGGQLPSLALADIADAAAQALHLTSRLPAMFADIAAERGLKDHWTRSLNQAEVSSVCNLWKGGSIRRLHRVVKAVINARGQVEQKH